MLIHLLEHVSPEERFRLAEILSRPRDDRSTDDIAWIRDRMDAHMSIPYAQRVAHGLAGAAQHAFEEVFRERAGFPRPAVSCAESCDGCWRGPEAARTDHAIASSNRRAVDDVHQVEALGDVRQDRFKLLPGTIASSLLDEQPGQALGSSQRKECCRLTAGETERAVEAGLGGCDVAESPLGLGLQSAGARPRRSDPVWSRTSRGRASDAASAPWHRLP